MIDCKSHFILHTFFYIFFLTFFIDIILGYIVCLVIKKGGGKGDGLGNGTQKAQVNKRTLQVVIYFCQTQAIKVNENNSRAPVNKESLMLAIGKRDFSKLTYCV